MSVITSIYKPAQDKLKNEFEGISQNLKGVFLQVGGINVPMVNDQGQVQESLYQELAEQVRNDIRGQYNNNQDFFPLYAKQLQKEVNAFFALMALQVQSTIKARIDSENRILAVYEQRKMIDFLHDSSFKKHKGNKPSELEDFKQQNYLNPNVSFDNQPEIDLLLQDLNNCAQRYSVIDEAYDCFINIMRDLVTLTNKVNTSKNANETIKSTVINNLTLLNELTFDDMQAIGPIFSVSVEAQKQLFVKPLTKVEFIQVLKS